MSDDQSRHLPLLNVKTADFLASPHLNMEKFLQVIKYMEKKQGILSTDDIEPLIQYLTISKAELLNLLYFGNLIESLEEKKAGIISLAPFGRTIANISDEKGELTPLIKALITRVILVPDLTNRPMKEQICLRILQELCSGCLLDSKLHVRHVTDLQSSVFVPEYLARLSKIDQNLLAEELGLLEGGELLNAGCTWNHQIEIDSTIVHVLDLYRPSSKQQTLIAVRNVFDHFFSHQTNYKSAITGDTSILLTGITREVSIEIVQADHLLKTEDLVKYSKSNCILISYGLTPGLEELLDSYDIHFIPAINLFKAYHGYRLELEKIKDPFIFERFNSNIAALIEDFFEATGTGRYWSSSLHQKIAEIAELEQKKSATDISVDRVEQWIYTLIPVLPKIKLSDFKRNLGRLKDSSKFDPMWKIEQSFLQGLRSLITDNIGTSQFGDAGYYLANLLSPIIARCEEPGKQEAQLLLLDDTNPYIVLIYRETIYAGLQPTRVLSLQERIEDSQKFGNESLTVLEEAFGSYGKFPRYGFTVITEIDNPADPRDTYSPWEIEDAFLQTCLRRLRISLTHPEHALIGTIGQYVHAPSPPSNPPPQNILVPLDIELVDKVRYHGWLLFTSEGILGDRNAPYSFHPDIILQLYIEVVLPYFSNNLTRLLAEINSIRLRIDYYQQVAWHFLHESSSSRSLSIKFLERMKSGAKRELFIGSKREKLPRTVPEVLAHLNNQVRPKMQEIDNTLYYSSLEESIAFIESFTDRLHQLTIFSENNQFPSFASYKNFKGQFSKLINLKKKANHDIELIRNQITELTEIIELYINDRSKRLLEWLAYLSIISVLGEVVISSYLFELLPEAGDPLPLVALLSSGLVVLLAFIVIGVVIALKLKDRVYFQSVE
ncbi:MAG: hypothetical protein ACXAEU_15740 [Candidatus Hodarchaeales archaeon]